MLCFASFAQAGVITGTEPPVGFFTNIAGRLLHSELNLSLEHIPLFPTNHYTPELHRLLQVAANLYDATTNRGDSYPYYPTVFRPVFGRNGEEIFITGYVEETGVEFINHPWRDLNNIADRLALAADDNVYDVPLVIGVKKGFPNFNEFVLQTAVQVGRKLELVKPTLSARPIQTNTMYTVSVSNLVAVETWNSYTQSFPRPLELRTRNLLKATVTNQAGLSLSRTSVITQTLTVAAWLSNRFIIPINNNFIFLTNDAYRTQSAPHFEAASTSPLFEPGVALPPELQLSVANQFYYFLIDQGRVVDAANLSGLISSLSVTQALLQGMPPGSALDFFGTDGIANQMFVSLGYINESSVWIQDGAFDPATGSSPDKAIAYFRWFMGLPPVSQYPTNGLPTPGLRAQALFIPIRRIYQTSSWQVNDPLVHSLVEDLRDSSTGAPAQIYPLTSPSPLTNLGRLNQRYRPWGGSPCRCIASAGWPDPRESLFTTKDPLVWQPDDWSFPTNLLADLPALGRVHRGTPWQTIYLKSAAASMDEWRRQSAAPRTHPTNDWRLAGLLIEMLNTIDPRSRLSINANNPAVWMEALSGLTVLSNSLSDAVVCCAPNGQAVFDLFSMTADSPQAAFITEAIQHRRSLFPGQHFSALGELLATPELSDSSPWLHRSPDQDAFGFTDDALETIPRQLLPRLRPDSFGTVVHAETPQEIQFTGWEGFDYAVETSTNLRDWETISTNRVENGVFRLVVPAISPSSQFYRSRLLP